MATPEVLGISSEIYNELVNDVFAALKDGKLSLGEIALLASKMVNKLLPSVNLSLEKKKELLSDILKKGLERVEKEVGPVLSDSDKSSVSEWFLKSVLSSFQSASVVAELGKPYFGFLFGLCCGGGPLPLEPSQVVSKIQAVQAQVQEQVQAVQAQVQEQVQAVQEQVQAVQTQVQEQVQAVQAQVQEQVQAVQAQVQEQVQAVQAQVQEQVQAVQEPIQEPLDHQVTLTILEPPCDDKLTDPLPSTVTEQNPQVEASKVPKNDLD